MAQNVTLNDVSSKLRIVQPKPPGDALVSTAGKQTSRVTPMENGINLNRTDGGLIEYHDISMVCAFRLDIDPDTWYLDVFVYKQPGAFRISHKVITYRQFLSEVSPRSKDSFYAFLLHLISQIDSVYVDDHTLNFLKTKKIASFPDFALFEDYTRQLWHQIASWMTFTCDQCDEIYWVDDAKIPESGAKTKCVKCQQIISVKKRDIPTPLHKEAGGQSLKEVCPHCQYDNAKGAQFCVMCQNPLGGVKPKAAKKSSATRPSPPAGTVQERSEQEQQVPLLVSAPPAPVPEEAPREAWQQRKPSLVFHEIETALRDDIRTLSDPFAWFSKFSLVMQILAFVFLLGGVLLAFYIYFAYPDPPLPAVFTKDERLLSAGISIGSGIAMFLGSMITANIVALMLQIERNTRVTTLLLQKLFDKGAL